MIPSKIAQTVVADLLHARTERMIHRAEHERRSERKGPGCEGGATRLLSECGAIRRLAPTGEVSAETVGLLAAYAAGCLESLAVLERLYPGITDISSRNYAEIVRVILS